MRTFPWFFTLLWLAVFLLMVWLGFWQLDRAEQKDQIHQQMQSGEYKQPKSGSDWQKINDYQTIRVTGRYDNTHFLLANQFHDGQVGFYVMTAFLTDNNLWLLVNRGWTASAGVDVSVPEGETELIGLLSAWPRPGVQLGDQIFKEMSKQQVTYLPVHQTKVFLTQQVCQRGDCQILDRIVKLNVGADHGFVRDWQAPMMTAARHRAYAFQWFMMCLALCLLYFYFLFKSDAFKK
ncbi:MAG: SURF1 family protein [Marinicella pacifica]